MTSVTSTVPDVFSAREIARAAGVRPRDVRALILAAGLIDRRWAGSSPRRTRSAPFAARGAGPLEAGRGLFDRRRARRSPRAGPLRPPGTLHAAMLAGLVVLTTMGVASAPDETRREPTHMRLVFLVDAGTRRRRRRRRTPAARAAAAGGAQGPERSAEPVPPPRRITTRPPDPAPADAAAGQARAGPASDRAAAPLSAEPLPPVVAPVVTVAADRAIAPGVDRARPAPGDRQPRARRRRRRRNRTGHRAWAKATARASGPDPEAAPAADRTAPGSGITAPSILREVKPDYTEEGRRRNLEGDVVLEIVVRSDGTVGDVKLLQGLGAGLDQRAIEAVRQWRFSPARRYGTPVDVIVEVAMEFKLR